jgi:acetate kinase
MIVLTINSGSTSVKLAAFEQAAPNEPLRQRLREQLSASGAQALEVLRPVLAQIDLRELAVVAHRVVHGGTRFVQPVRIDTTVEAALRELGELAPLHNPVALRWIDAARQLCPPAVRQVAAFDTAFFAALPRLAHEYALPASAGAALGVRRYGFHGLAHEAMWRRWCELQSQPARGGRIITLQLGGGCSAAAIEHGRPLDTSMGFSPLEGLVMATRSGDVDAAIVPFLARRLKRTPDAVIDLLNHESGLLGVSGRSSDLRELLADDCERARFAIELYCYRVRKYVGAYFAVLGGCDGVVFGGGVGEHSAEIRERILGPLEFLGIKLDDAANAAARGQEALISRPDSRTAVRVIPVDEEHALAVAGLSCSGS